MATVVLGGGYAGLCVWSSQHVPATVSVGGIQVGGMTPESARAAIAQGLALAARHPDRAQRARAATSPVQVVPRDAGLAVDADRSLDGLTGFTLDPRVSGDGSRARSGRRC